ncbi:MAG TPA: transglutaminase domain-containing protein [Verrucomicrobiae bacterium]|nr:transglutaminase domain-containing protein [Verrucomicrobiae bacterium]
MQNVTTPSPTPNGAASAPSAPRSNKKVILIVGAIILAVVVLMGIFLFSVFRLVSNQTTKVTFSGDLPYQFTEPQLNLDPRHKFVFNAAIDPTAIDSEHKNAIQVYSDSAFTKEVPASSYYFDGKLEISAPSAINAIGSGTTTGKSVALTGYETWGLFKEYFLVQRRDLSTGQPLEKPIVTKFTVKPAALATPKVSYTIDDRGAVQFSWEKVAGADAYYIVKLEYDKGADDRANLTADLIGETKDTKWDSVQQDKYLQQDLNNPSRGVVVQNSAFKNFLQSEDDLRNAAPGSLTEGEKKKITEYGVVAFRAETVSSLGGVAGEQIEPQLPVNIAHNARREQDIPADVSVGTFDAIPKQIPVTMADGKTALRPVMVSAEGVTKGEIISNETGQPGDTRRIITLKVPYKVQGTLISGFYHIKEYSDATYPQEIARIATRNKAAQAKTGNFSTYTYATPKKDLSSITISKAAPEVPYKVNATNSFTNYIAANMIAGSEYIDVSQFQDSPIDLWDAYREAISQNPYILAVKSAYFYDDRNLLEVQYYGTADQRKQEQQAIAAEIRRVTSSIIKPGMSDSAKVTAINNYLIEHAEYNYDALGALKTTVSFIPDQYTRSWTPAGTLIDKKGVCASYAYAFKALADAAGLQAVYVTGLANGERHAWNKVKVDGKWRAIDVTWNDTPVQTNSYFLLTDQHMSKDHQQDDDFVIDVLAGQFATQ